MITGIGFIEGIHFERQFSLKSGKRPDFIFYLPKEKNLLSIANSLSVITKKYGKRNKIKVHNLQTIH